MKHFSGYGACMLFLALRTHFTNAKYDFFQFNGKLRVTKETYERRNDKYFFEKVAKELSCDELKDFYISNLLKDKHYITELLDDEATQNLTEYNRRRQSLSYIFTSELDRVFRNGITNSFVIRDGVYPDIISLYLRGSVSPETMVITNNFLPFFPKFDKYLGEADPIWSKISLKLNKYRPFLKYDRDRFKRILKEKINDTQGDRIRNIA